MDAPPDGRWLTDDQGRQYFVREIPKLEGGYFKPTPDTVRLGRGETYELLGEDDTTFKVKVYRLAAPPRPAAAAPAKPKAEVAASYRGEAGVSDRWQLTDFGRGLPQRGQWRDGFVVVDLDGDGHLDIVHGPPRKGGAVPVVFFGDGQGGWRQERLSVSRPEGYDYGDVAVADFNQDGRLDIALGVHLKGIVVMIATPAGAYQEWSEGIDYTVPGEGVQPVQFSSRAIAATDWNGDGRIDLVALGEGPRFDTARPGADATKAARSFGLAVFENLGDGKWQPRFENSRDYGETLDIGDLDGDGRPDAALGTNVLGVDRLLRYGRENGPEVATVAVRPKSYSQAVRMADLNHDGRLDLLVGYVGAEGGVWRYGVDVYFARPDHTFDRHALFSADGRKAVSALAVGDLDGDGRADIVALTSEGETLLFRGNERGLFDRETSPEVTPLAGCRGFHVEAADVDGDGTAEVLAGFAGEPTIAVGATPLCPSLGALRAWKVIAGSSRKP